MTAPQADTASPRRPACAGDAAAVSDSAALREPWKSLDEQRQASTSGIWIFIASEILFFDAFFMAYGYLRLLHPAAFALASSHAELAYGRINTVLLLTSSATMGLAVTAASLGLGRACWRLLATTARFGLAFLCAKAGEYRADIAEGLIPLLGHTRPIDLAAAQLFFSATWVITVVHLSIGIAAVATLAWCVRRGTLPPVSPQLDVTAMY